MNKIYVLPENELRGEIYRRMRLLMSKNPGSWQTIVAAVGLFGGMASIVLGGLVWAFVGLSAPSGALGSLLNAAGTVLLVLPLPLLAMGACCLDLLEEKAAGLPLAAGSRLGVRAGSSISTAGPEKQSRPQLNPDFVPGTAAARGRI